MDDFRDQRTWSTAEQVLLQQCRQIDHLLEDMAVAVARYDLGYPLAQVWIDDLD